jgi:hypothetical protein
VRISEQRFEKDLRRYELAQRMIAHEARRGTIVRWTGLSRHRVALLLKEFNRPEKNRYRGPPPCTAAFFCKTLAHESESAAFAYVGMQMNVIEAPADDPAAGLAALARAEKLVRAFELYREVVPNTRFSLEHVMLLVSELSTKECLLLDVCEDCGGLWVREKVGRPQRWCPFCRAKGLRPAIPQIGIAGELLNRPQSSDKQASST